MLCLPHRMLLKLPKRVRCNRLQVISERRENSTYAPITYSLGLILRVARESRTLVRSVHQGSHGGKNVCIGFWRTLGWPVENGLEAVGAARFRAARPPPPISSNLLSRSPEGRPQPDHGRRGSRSASCKRFNGRRPVPDGGGEGLEEGWRTVRIGLAGCSLDGREDPA